VSVFIDNARMAAPHLVGGRARWAHLSADSPEELIAFADRLGLKRAWFQPGCLYHYDVVDRLRTEAIRLGAEPVTSRELVRRVKAATEAG